LEVIACTDGLICGEFRPYPAERMDTAHDLAAGDDGNPGMWNFAIDVMQVGTAYDFSSRR
jgi:hypothetical protein